MVIPDGRSSPCEMVGCVPSTARDFLHPCRSARAVPDAAWHFSHPCGSARAVPDAAWHFPHPCGSARAVPDAARHFPHPCGSKFIPTVKAVGLKPDLHTASQPGRQTGCRLVTQRHIAKPDLAFLTSPCGEVARSAGEEPRVASSAARCCPHLSPHPCCVGEEEMKQLQRLSKHTGLIPDRQINGQFY
jgi:hypothetical protein